MNKNYDVLIRGIIVAVLTCTITFLNSCAGNVNKDYYEKDADKIFLCKKEFDLNLFYTELFSEIDTAGVHLLGKEDNLVRYCTYRSGKDNLLKVCYYDLSVDTKQKELIAESSDCFTVVGNYIYKKGIIYAEIERDENLQVSVFYQEKNSGRKSLFDFESSTIPEFCLIGDKLIVSYELVKINVVEQKVKAIYFETGRVDELITESYRLSDKNMCSGKMIMGLCGDENGLIYQSIEFDEENPDLDNTGKARIIRYDLDEKKSTVLVQLKKKASFIGGVADKLIISDYTYDRPLENTGLLYLKNEKGDYDVYHIPGIESVNDIKNCKIINEYYAIIQSYNAMYLINTQSYEYDCYENAYFVCSEGIDIYYTDHQGGLFQASLGGL